MSYDLSKNFIELYNKKFDKIEKKLDNEQIEKLYNKISNLDKKKEYYINDYDKLVLKMKDSYYIKSARNLEYFIKNNLTKINKNTGEIFDYKYKDNCFKYLSYFNRDNNDNLTFEEVKKGEYLHNQDTIYSYKKISKVRYLDYINEDKEKIFITFTLPNKEFHKYNNKKELTNTYNSEDLFEENIERGLKKINEIHNYFYKTLKFKIDRYCKKYKIKNKEIRRVDFIKIIEPHKSLDGHSHELFYIDNLFIDIIEEVYNMTIDYYKLKQTKFEKLKNIKGSSYLTKYLLKTLKTDKNKDNKEDLEINMYNYYKRYFSQYRFFTSSNYKHTNQIKIDLVYKYLFNHKKELLDRYKRSEKPLYYLLEKLILKKVFTFEEENKTSFIIDFTKIKKEYKEVLKRFKIDKSLEKEKISYKEIIRDKKTNFNIDITVDSLEDLYFTIEHTLKEENNISEYNYVKRFKQKIIKNLNDYIRVVNRKVVSKMYYKNSLILDKNDFEYEKMTNQDIKNLLNNPFLEEF